MKTRTLLFIGVGLSVLLSIAVAAPAGAEATANFQLETNVSTSTPLQLTVAIYEDSQHQSVNAVQTNITYDKTQLKFVRIDLAGSAFTYNQPITPTEGLIRLENAKLGATLTGRQFIAKVIFSSLSSHGTARIAVATGSAIVASPQTKNIWNGGPSMVTVDLSNQLSSTRVSGGAMAVKPAQNNTIVSLGLYLLVATGLTALIMFTLRMKRNTAKKLH